MSLNKIVFTSELHSGLFDFLSGYSQVAVLVDENSREHCYPLVKAYLPEHQVIEIKSGEENKTLRTCEHIWGKMTDFQFDRKAILINLGGGVIGDMGGFCASTYKRGIDFIQIPTTLLSQVDASVGGKLGIDFHSFKNHIGLFRIPDLVLIYPDFIKTLPENEIKSGFAEVIKHCLIADKKQWEHLTSQPYTSLNWHEIIPHSVKIKEQVVESDPKENGLRKILNFGHTVGHAVESYLLPIPGRKLLHGEAIAVGTIAELYLSEKKCAMPEKEVQEVKEYILQTYGKISLSSEDIDQIKGLALQDKKNEGATINSSLLTGIGECVYDQAISLEEIAASLEYYKNC
ncbi:3-dehydroquinate synthase [Rapidithrix thailandica]|uniref:3-dehydroquinate synthase n=1 Tax=Rapidithrix thailandica TaxID=413964 RepID=A0AAW9SAX1_9BACT